MNKKNNKPKKPVRYEWCETWGKHCDRGKIRCPTCNRQMMAKTQNAEPMGRFEAYYVIPRHKRRV